MNFILTMFICASTAQGIQCLPAVKFDILYKDVYDCMLDGYTKSHDKIIEHRIQPSLSQCLKGKRIAMRDKKPSDRITYKCIKSKANIEIYMGEKKITSLILE